MSEKNVEYAQKVSMHIKELGFLLEKRKFLESQIKSIKRDYEHKRIGKKEYESLLGSYSKQTSPESEKLEGDILAGIGESKKCLAAISLILEGKQVPMSFNIRVDAPVPFSFSVNIGRPEWHGLWGRLRELLRRILGRRAVVEEKAPAAGKKEGDAAGKKGWALPIIVRREVIERKEVVEKRVEAPAAREGGVPLGAEKGFFIGETGKGIPVRIAREGEAVKVEGIQVGVAKEGKKGTPKAIAKEGVPAAIPEEAAGAAEGGGEGFFSRLFSKKRSPVLVKGAAPEKAHVPSAADAAPQKEQAPQPEGQAGEYAIGGGITRRDGFFKRLFSKDRKKGVVPEVPRESAVPTASVEALAVKPQEMNLKMDVIKKLPEQRSAEFAMPPPPKLEDTIRLKEVTPLPEIGGEHFKNEAVPLKSGADNAQDVKFKAFKFSIGALMPKIPFPSLKIFSAQPKPMESRTAEKAVPKVRITRDKKSFTTPRKSLIFLTVEAPTTYQALANRLVGWMVDRMPSISQPLFWKIHESGTRVLHRTYVSVALFTTIIVGVLSAIFFLLYNPFYILFSLPIAISVFGIYYWLPFIVASNRRRNVEVNLPFAIHHMAAIASSGVTPYVMFKILTDFTEYGEVSAEATKIIRHVDVFGQDILLAIKEVNAESPSRKFSEFLNGITSTIETGGDIREFLQLRAREAIFEYEIERKKYTEALATYADFFTVILVAAPLFLVAVLTIISMLGSGTKIMGFSPDVFMNYATYLVLPAVHLAFLGFLATSQPEV